MNDNSARLNQIIQGDALEVLESMPDNSVNMCMTSPPYYGLRDYGIEQQIGLEKTPEEYLSRLLAVFDEVRRVLRDDGTCWVNLGDTYGGTKVGNTTNKWDKINTDSFKKRTEKKYEKCMLCIPERFALGMIERGWILRNKVVWAKPNPMPESVKDRFATTWEYVYFFTKSGKYWFDLDVVRVPSVTGDGVSQGIVQGKRFGGNSNAKGSVSNFGERELYNSPNGKNPGDLWTIPTQPFPEAHFATYPEKLCHIPIKAGCPEGGIVLDPFAGSNTTGLVADKLGRNWIAIELSEEYIKIAKQRTAQERLI